MKYIGQSVARVDAMSKVKGEAVFASDMIRPGQAYMKMLMAHRPHAIVKRVDTSKAEALPGVLTVLTSQDVPCNEFGYYTYDQPVLCGPSEKPFADRVRFVGDRVAAVVAETEAAAAKARDLIEVEYEDLPAVCDVEEAMQPGAPIAFYLSILVTVTFYIRSQISMNSFRTIHYLSIIAYLGALLHGLYAGTDSLLNWTRLMYWGTLLSTIFFGVYWLVIVRLQSREKSNSQIRVLET